MRRRDWWLGVLAVCTTIAVCALPVRGQVVADPGKVTCATWQHLRAHDTDIFNPFAMSAAAWVQGYFDGAWSLGLLVVSDVHGEARERVQQGARATAGLRRADDIPAGIDTYCTEHPDDTIGVMTLRLLRRAYGH